MSLCKRRGFIFPASEIYGGLANSYSYGPYGVELKNNIKALWWKMFVRDREDIVGLDGPILLHPKVWEASGHTTGFNDAMTDCKKCRRRFRADHIVEQATGLDLEGDNEKMTAVMKAQKIKCPECGAAEWTAVRNFNMMFRTEMNGIADNVYLRPETAGAIFIDFKNVIDSMRVKLPFGIAQIGKAFRNEIVAGNFIFRLREFEQMEIEYFIAPDTDWAPLFEDWLKLQEEYARALGVVPGKLRRYEHPAAKLAHYSKKTVDLEYDFPFGFKELYGLAHRADFDLTAHARFSGADLSYLDPATGKRFVPHVLEPTFGVDRSVLACLHAAYREEEVNGERRTVLGLPHRLAPVAIAVFPLLKNKPELVAKARTVFEGLKADFLCEFDDNGNIGKRYRRQDEIGTPFCVTIDFDSLAQDDATVRERDSMKQERVKIGELGDYFKEKLG